MTLYDIKKGREIESIDLPLSLALGTFDGVHLGHAKLINTAKKQGDAVCVFTFSKNPFSVPQIVSFEDKLRLLGEAGADYCAYCSFEDIKELPWQNFIEDIIIKKLNVKTAVCGFNFKFGKDALGTALRLKEEMEMRNRNAIILEPFELSGEIVSSSRIRMLLAEGNVQKASQLLGRPYSMIYKVCRGNGIGNTIGFPTINTAALNNSVDLAHGVYISRCLGRPAVTNFGVRPTVTDQKIPVYETFILDYESNLYEKEIRVEFLKMLRPEYDFGSKEALAEQITRDVEVTREYFNQLSVSS